MAAAAPHRAAPPAPSLSRVPPHDAWILHDVERALSDGLRLRRWWEQAEAANSYRTRFSFLKNLMLPERVTGFFDETEIAAGRIPVMGYVHDMVFDRPKSGSAEEYREQIREFALRYLFRVSVVAPPEPEGQLGQGPVSTLLLKLLRVGPPRTEVYRGFGHAQLYYQDAASGEVAAFPAAQRAAIVDVRDIGPKYRWIVLRARPFDYELDLAPVGPAGPRVVIPLPDSPTLAMNRELIVDEDHPAPGILGRYGVTYALLNDPTVQGPQVYGPAQFKACFQTIHFEVLENGESRVRMVFVGNLPDRILDVKLDPVGLTLRAGDWLSAGLTSRMLEPFQGLIAKRPTFGGFDPLLGFISLANVATAGLASEGFDISRQQLFRDILAQHFSIYYQRMLDCLLAYRQVSDWRREAELPAWAREGVSIDIN